MPSEYLAKFVIAQQRPGEQLRRQDLHGMIGTLIGHGEQQAPLWSLGRWRIDGPVLTVAVRFRDDELAARLNSSLARLAGALEAGGRNTLGPMRWEVAAQDMPYLHQEHRVTWQELASAQPVTKCAVQVTTPLNFAKKSAEFDMFKALTSLHRQWTDAGTRPDATPIQRNSFISVFEHATPYTVVIEKAELFGVCGWWAIKLRTPEPELARSVGQLLALAPYCGVGYGTAYGLGQIRVHPLNAMMSPRLAPRPFVEGAVDRHPDSRSGAGRPLRRPAESARKNSARPKAPRSDKAPVNAEERKFVITRTNPTG